MFASQGAPQVATGINDTGGKFFHLYHRYQTPVANNGNNMRILTPKNEAEGTNLCTCYLYYPKASKQNNLNFSDRRFFPFVHLLWEYLREFLRKKFGLNHPFGILRGFGETYS
jgi:hypothetical protein